MDYYFKRCLEKRNLVKVGIDNNLIKKERENADYRSDFSKKSAELLITKAGKFLQKAKILLNE